MISSIYDVKVAAGNLNFPLRPLFAFKGGANSVRVLNVPKKIGLWRITSVQVQAEYPDGSIRSVEAVQTGSVWVATFGPAAQAGFVKDGYRVTAGGVDENGGPVEGYVLGVGDFTVQELDRSVPPGFEADTVRILDARPETPKRGDAVVEDGVFIVYDGAEWVSGGGGTSDYDELDNRPTINGETVSGEISGMLPQRLSQLENDAGFPTYENPGRFIKYDTYDPGQLKWYINFGKESYGGITLYSDSETPANSYIDVAGNIIRANVETVQPEPPGPEEPEEPEDAFTANYDAEQDKWFDQDGKEIYWDENSNAWWYENDADGDEPMGVGKPPEYWTAPRARKLEMIAPRVAQPARLMFNDVELAFVEDVPTSTSELDNDAGFVTSADMPPADSLVNVRSNGKLVTTQTLDTPYLGWPASILSAEYNGAPATVSQVVQCGTSHQGVRTLENGTMEVTQTVDGGFRATALKNGANGQSLMLRSEEGRKAEVKTGASSASATFNGGEDEGASQAEIEARSNSQSVVLWTNADNTAQLNNSTGSAALTLKHGGHSVEIAAASDGASIKVDGKPFSGGSSYEIKNLTPVESGDGLSCAVSNYAVNVIDVSSELPLSVFLPEAEGDNARDFVVRLNVASSTPPTVTFVPQGDDDTVFESDDESWAEIQTGANVISFSETQRG